MPSRRVRRTFSGALLGAALVASACEGPARIEPLGPPAPGEIRGRFVRFDGSPVAGVPICIGDRRISTGHDGTFRFTGIDIPYDLVVEAPGSMFVYQGVTRTDPILTDPDTRVGYSHTATLVGSVPAAAGLQTLVFLTGAYPNAQWRYADSRTGAYSMEVVWDGSAESRHTTLYALRRREAALVDLATRSLRVRDQARHTLELRAEVFEPVRSFDITGTVRMPFGTQSYVIRQVLSIDGSSLTLDARNGPGSVPSFAFAAPEIPGAVFDVEVSTVRSGYSGTSYRRVTSISPETGPLALQLYDPPALVEPSHEAELDSATAVFRWAEGEGPGIYAFSLTSARRMLLYTRRTQASWADTPALAQELRSGHGYFWSVRKLHAASSTDDLLTAENRGTLAASATTARRFLFRAPFQPTSARP